MSVLDACAAFLEKCFKHGSFVMRRLHQCFFVCISFGNSLSTTEMLLTEQELVLLTVSCIDPSLVCHFCVFYIILLIWLLIQEWVLRTVYETILICVSRCSVRQLLTPPPLFFFPSFFSIASSLAHGDTLQFVVLRYRECHGLKCSCCCPVRSAQKTYTMAFCFKPWCCKLGFYFKNLCWKLRIQQRTPCLELLSTPLPNCSRVRQIRSLIKKHYTVGDSKHPAWILILTAL